MDKKKNFSRRRRSGVVPNRFKKGFGSTQNKSKSAPKRPSKPKAGTKGAPSKTRKNDMDYTTKRGDRDFHRGGKDIPMRRQPFDY